VVHPRVVALWGGALLAGCSPSPGVPARPAAPLVKRAPAPPPSLDDGRWGELGSQRFALRLPLPSAARWTVDDRRGPWLSARDPATHSELRLRAWRAPRRVAPADCEVEARALGPTLPLPGPEDLVERSERRLDSGLVLQLLCAARPLPGTEGVAGYVLGFGAMTGRCLALVYETSERGPEAAARVGARLAVVTDGMFARVSFRRVEDRGHEARPER